MQDINLYQLLTFYAKKWKWITAATLLGALAGLLYNFYIQVPLYKSDATLLVIGESTQKSGQDSILINNYLELIKSRRVLEPVISRYHQSMSYDDLVKTVTATSEKNTEVIKISIASTDPETSKKLVDGTIESFRDAVKDLYEGDNISTVDSASKEEKPYNVNQVKQAVTPAVGGLVISVVVLFFVYDLKIAKKSTSKVKKTRMKKATPTKVDAPLTVKVATPKSKKATKKKAVKKVVELIVGDQTVAPTTAAKKRPRQSKSTKATKTKK